MKLTVDESGAFRRGGTSCALALLLGTCVTSWSQGTFLPTGGGLAVTSRTVVLNPQAGAVQPVLTFDFGFATDETFAPEQFFDSFSVTLRGANQAFATLLTADVSGVLWAPATPGGVPVNQGAISRIQRPFPTTATTYRTADAYSVSWPIPQQLRGGSLDVSFDLFDNLDANASLAFFTTPVIVPETSTASILAIGWVLLIRRLRRA